LKILKISKKKIKDFKNFSICVLDVHGIQQLVLHVVPFHRLKFFKQAIGHGNLSMVDMGNGAKIPYLRNIFYSSTFFLKFFQLQLNCAAFVLIS
jgi:hypothetical protein